MKQELKFFIHPLLSKTKDGTVSGAMSPLLFAQEMAQQCEFKFNRLARVGFDDEHIHQQREDGGYTGHDTLLIGSKYKNDFWLSLWVDTGIGGIPAAMCYQSDRNLVTTPVYLQTSFAVKLSHEQIAEIFDYVFNTPETIAIKLKP